MQGDDMSNLLMGAKGGVETSRLEIMLSGVENRLRTQISDLIVPTLQKVTLQGEEITGIRAMVTDHAIQINNFNAVQNKVHENKAILDAMRDDMSKMDAKVHQHLTRQVEENRQLTLEVEAVQKALEQKESAINHMQRGLDRAGLEMSRIQEQVEAQGFEYIDSRLEESRRAANKMICEVEAKMINLQLDHSALTDKLWGEETGLAKVTGDMAKMQRLVDDIRCTVSALQETAVAPEDLTRVREDVAAWLAKADSDMSGLRCTVGNVVDETKEHLRTGLETVALQTAHFVGEVRSAYTEEIKSSQSLREQVDQFVKKTKDQVESLEERFTTAHSNMESLVKDNLELIQRNDIARKRDRAVMDLEVKNAHKRLTSISDSLDRILKGLDHLWGVTGMMLEAAGMQCALDSQDTKDRETVSLLGMQEKSSGLEDPGAFGNAGSPTKHASPGRRKGGKQVVTVDQRCLSCSGQATTVLTAFKLACLQYSPSAVAHNGQEFARVDLLSAMRDLVAKAQAKYVADPEGKWSSITSLTQAARDSRAVVTEPQPPSTEQMIPTPRGAAPRNRSVVIAPESELYLRRANGAKLPQLSA